MEAQINIDRIGDDLVAAFNDGYRQGLADARAEWKTGKWIHRKVEPQSPYQPYVPSIELFCSECNNHSAWDSPFCPNCGVRMVPEEDIPMEYFESGGK